MGDFMDISDGGFQLLTTNQASNGDITISFPTYIQQRIYPYTKCLMAGQVVETGRLNVF